MKLQNKSQTSILVYAAILSISILSLITSGCDSTERYEGSRAFLNERPVDVNEPAPFRGVLIGRVRYEHLLRCENAAEQNGLIP